MVFLTEIFIDTLKTFPNMLWSNPVESTTMKTLFLVLNSDVVSMMAIVID